MAKQLQLDVTKDPLDDKQSLSRQREATRATPELFKVKQIRASGRSAMQHNASDEPQLHMP